MFDEFKMGRAKRSITTRYEDPKIGQRLCSISTGGGGGSSGSTQSTSTSYSTNIPEYAQPYVESMLNATQQQLFNVNDQGQVTGFAPYQAYGGTYDDAGNMTSYNPAAGIAGFTPLQQQVQENVANLQTPGQFGLGSDYAAAAGEGALGSTGVAYGYGGAGMAAGQAGAGIGQGALGYGSLGSQYGQLGTQYGNLGSTYGALGSNYGGEGAELGVRQGQAYGLQGSQYGQQGAQSGLLGQNIGTTQGLSMGQAGVNYGSQASAAGQAGQTAGNLLGTQYGTMGATYGGQGAAAGQAGQNIGAQGLLYGQQASDYGREAGIAGRLAQDIGVQQGNVYGTQAAAAGQAGQNLGLTTGVGMGQTGMEYGAQGAATGQQALGYGQAAANIGQQATQAAQQGFGAQAAYQAQATSPEAMQAYMNPYIAASLDPQLKLMNQQLAQTQNKNKAQAVASGAYGGSRQAIQQSLDQQNADLAKAQLISQGYNTAFQQAQQAQQYGAGLGIQGLGAGTSALQAGIAGQQAGMQGVQGALAGTAQGMQGAQVGLQGVQAGLAGTAQGIQGAQAGMQGAQLGIQGTQANIQGLQAGMQGSGLGMQGAQTAMQGTAQGMQGAGLGMQGAQVGLQGAQTVLAGTAQGIQGAQAGMQGVQTGLQGVNAALAGTSQGIQGSQAGMQGSQVGLQGTQAALQGTGQGIQGAQTGISGAQAGIAGAQTGISGAQTGIQGVQGALAGNAQALQGAQIGLQGVQGAQAGYGLANQAAGQLGQLGTQQLAGQQGILGLQSQVGAQEQAYQQQILNQAMQDYANAQQYPLMQLGTMSNMLRGLPLQSATTQQYVAQPNQTTQAIGTLGAVGSLSQAMRAKGGVIKEKKYASGGIIGYDVGGAVESTLYDMDKDQLQKELKSPSPSIQKMARRILAEKQAEGMAGGGIIAFSGGTPDPEIIPAEDRTATDVQFAAPNPQAPQGIVAAPAPAPAPRQAAPSAPVPTTSEGLKGFLAQESQRQFALANRPVAEGLAERRAYVGEDTAGQEYRKKIMEERANAGDEAVRNNWLRAAQFFADWGSRPGNTLAAGMMALKNSIPDVISDQKEQKKYLREIDKTLYELDKAARAERAGDYDAEIKHKEKAAEIGWKGTSELSSIIRSQEQIAGNIKAASISANRETDMKFLYNTKLKELTGGDPSKVTPAIEAQAAQWASNQAKGLPEQKLDYKRIADVQKEIGDSERSGTISNLEKSRRLALVQAGTPEKEKAVNEDYDRRIADAKQEITNRIMQGGQQPAATQQPGPTNAPAPTALPLPTSQDQLKAGQVYNTSRGPAKWDGKQFVAS